MPSRSSSIRPYAAYDPDEWWCSHWLERRGGNGGDELLEVMGIVEREKEMNRVEREDAWRHGTPIREQPMPHSHYSRRTFHPCLFDHDHVHHKTGAHTTAYQIHPSTLVDSHRRSLSTQRRRNNPQRWCSPFNLQSNSPVQSNTAACPRAPERVPHAAAAGHGHH